jgi:hypothetical protein
MNPGVFAQASGRSGAGSDVAWKDKMRWRRTKTGGARGRPHAFASLLKHLDAKFFSGKWEKPNEQKMEVHR